MTNDTLYLNIDQNVEVHDTTVYLKDIAQLDCSNKINSRPPILFTSRLGKS